MGQTRIESFELNRRPLQTSPFKGTMTFFQDLTPCNYGGYSGLKPLLAVGWLDPPFDFARGTLNRSVRDRLEALFNRCWQPALFMGSHTCGFCERAAHNAPPHHADRRPSDLPSGSANFFIPGGHVVYLVPALILHYIDEHHYCPPPAFADAVAACPPIRSKDYFLALIAVGGHMPALVEGSGGDAGRQALLLWRHPLRRAWRRLLRGFSIDTRMPSEPLPVTPPVTPHLPRKRVANFLLRVAKGGHPVHEDGDDFVLPHPDGEIRVCPIGVSWVVRRKKGIVWYPHGGAKDEADLEQFLSSALGSPIL